MNTEKPAFTAATVVSTKHNEPKGIVHCVLSDGRTISMLAARGYPTTGDTVKLWFEDGSDVPCVATWYRGMADLKERSVMKGRRPAAHVDGDDYKFNPLTRRVFEAEKEAIRIQIGKKEAAVRCCAEIDRAQKGTEAGLVQLQDAKDEVARRAGEKCSAHIYQ